MSEIGDSGDWDSTVLSRFSCLPEVATLLYADLTELEFPINPKSKL